VRSDNSVRDKPQSPFIGPTTVEGWVIFGVMICTATLIGVFFGQDLGWIAADSMGALACLLAFAWPLRREPWFWAAFAIFAAVNAFGVMHFDWSFTHKWNGHELTSLGLIDLAVMAAIIYGIYCWTYGKPTVAVEPSPDEGATYGQRDLDL